jgi:hypothetical protein
MKLHRALGFRRMTAGEYRANINGLNTFFGAVLGFVISAIDFLDPFRFAYLLLLLSGVVISILYIHGSPHRIGYALMTLVFVAVLPRIAEPTIPDGAEFPGKIQATLAVWTLMTIFVEFMPREREDDKRLPDQA